MGARDPWGVPGIPGGCRGSLGGYHGAQGGYRGSLGGLPGIPGGASGIPIGLGDPIWAFGTTPAQNADPGHLCNCKLRFNYKKIRIVDKSERKL